MEMISNLINDVQAFWPLLQAVIFVIGLALIITALFKLSQAGSAGPQSQQSLKMGIAALIAGTLMINLWSFMDVLAQSVFESESAKGVGYVPPEGDAPGAEILKFAVIVIRVIGLGAWARGVYMIYEAQSGNGQSGYGSAIVFIVSGMIAINFVTFAETLGNSVGGEVKTAIHKWLVP